MRGSREISVVPSLHRASTDALIVSLARPSRKERESGQTAIVAINFSLSDFSQDMCQVN